jgi:hypothetical protein
VAVRLKHPKLNHQGAEGDEGKIIFIPYAPSAPWWLKLFPLMEQDA